MPRDAPPLFQLAAVRDPAPAGPATRSPEAWFAVANDICNALFDAASLAEIDRIRERHESTLADMVREQRDLAHTVSLGFADRRAALRRRQGVFA